MYHDMTIYRYIVASLAPIEWTAKVLLQISLVSLNLETLAHQNFAPIQYPMQNF